MIRLRRGLGAREHDEQEAGHEQGEEDLHGVLEEGHHVADVRSAPVDAFRAEPDDGDRGEVHDEHHDREEDGEEPVDLDRDRHEVEVGIIEAALLVVHPVEGPDDAYPREPLAQHEVDPVDLLLDGPEEGEALDGDGEDDGGEERDHRHDDPGKAPVLGHGHDDAADHHDRGADHHPHHDEGEHLHLGDVVRGPRDEGGGAELVELVERKAGHVGEDIVADQGLAMPIEAWDER